MFYELDSKTKIYVQKNRLSNLLKIGSRVMFANKYVYKITEFDDLVFDGMYTVVAQRDEIMPMDDFVNNLAWNTFDDDIEKPPLQEILISGSEKIILNNIEIYKTDIDCTWEIDDLSLATIVSSSNRDIQIKGIKRGWITLTATIGDVKCNKEILIA